MPCVYAPLLNSIIIFRTDTAMMGARPYLRIGPNDSILGLEDKKCISPPLQIGISQFGQVFPIRVRKFAIPSEELEQMSESEQRLYSHPYCIDNLGDTEQIMQVFLGDKMLNYIRNRSDSSDRLTLRMFQSAGERAQREQVRLRNSLASMRTYTLQDHDSLVKDSLHLWTAARTIEGGWRMVSGCGAMELDAIHNSPLVNAPMIDHQFSALMVKKMLWPLRSRVLKKLHKLTVSNKASQWPQLLLVNFILLDSLGRLMYHQRDFARRKRLGVCTGSRPSS